MQCFALVNELALLLKPLTEFFCSSLETGYSLVKNADLVHFFEE